MVMIMMRLVFRLSIRTIHACVYRDGNSGGGILHIKGFLVSLHYQYQKSVLLNYGPDYESYAFVHPARSYPEQRVDRTTQDTFISTFSPIFFFLFLFLAPLFYKRSCLSAL